MSRPRSLIEVVGGALPADASLVVGDSRRSSDDLAVAAARLAGGFVARGVEPGDRVAFDAPIAGDTVLLLRACWHLGVVAAPLHPRLGSAERDGLLARLAPRLTVTVEPGARATRRGPTATPSTSSDAPTDARAGEGGSNGADETLAVTGVGVGDWTELTRGDPVPPNEVDPDDPALIMFTSGSTGTPKGVVHTQASLAAKAVQILDVHDLGPGDAVLMPAPLAHVSGLLHGVLIPAVSGVKAVLMPRWEPGEALNLIEREQVTYMVGPPTFFLDLMDHPELSPERVESLRFLSCGGTGVTPAFAERAATELGCLVKRSYGSTEAPTVTTARNDDPVDRMVCTDGRAHGETEVRVGDLAPGADGEGELFVRGPEVATGYLDPLATAAAFDDGWFHTGDLGRLEDGWLTITGRLGDHIIRGGENISTSEVERVLESHPAVRQAVAVGVPDERLGERVGAAAVVEGELDLDECRRWFADQGAGRLLVPEHLIVVDRIPTLPAGKPDRSALADWLSADR